MSFTIFIPSKVHQTAAAPATVTDCIEESYSFTKDILIGVAVGGYYTIVSNYHNPGIQNTLYYSNTPIWLPGNQEFGVTTYLTSPGLQSSTWSRASNSYPFSWFSSGSKLNFSGTSGSTPYQTRNGIFNVSAQTSCGAFDGTFTWPVVVQGWSFTISVSPNPAMDYLIVSIKEELPNVNKEEDITMTLYDLNSTAVIKIWNFKNNQNMFNLNISGINRGHYILVVSKSNYQQSKQIIIEN
jgi:Secretion system C-terminal sorting domain